MCKRTNTQLCRYDIRKEVSYAQKKVKLAIQGPLLIYGHKNRQEHN